MVRRRCHREGPGTPAGTPGAGNTQPMSVLDPLRTLYLRHRIRKRRSAGRSVRLRVDDVAALFAEFERRGVRYLVMRWFDEVPLTPEARSAFVGDVDVLVADEDEAEIARSGARHRGPLAVELRSVHGRVGAYAGMPYYPPTFADEMLATRVRHPRGFYVPAPKLHVASLLFHLCYQKAEESGIPTGVSGVPAGKGKRDYAALLTGVFATVGERLPEPLTLLALHEYLVARGRDMSFDLLVRWPRDTGWIRHLRSESRKRLAAQAARLPDVMVLILREDMDPALHEPLLAVIRKRYRLIEYAELAGAARERVQRHVRGGNWHVKPGAPPAGPTHYILCSVGAERVAAETHDLGGAPSPNDSRIAQEKRALRARVRRLADEARSPARHALHGSDDALEAQHMLDAIFGGAAEAKRCELEKLLASPAPV